MVNIGTNRNRGMTLIELMLGIAIGAVITMAAASFFYTSQQLLAEGDDQSVTQDSVRMTAAYIADAVRNATSISVESVVGTTDEYIYVSGNRLWMKNGGAPATSISREEISAVSFTLRTVGGRWFMEYTVTGPRGFVVSSEVLLNNIHVGEAVEGTDAVVNYKK